MWTFYDHTLGRKKAIEVMREEGIYKKKGFFKRIQKIEEATAALTWAEEALGGPTTHP